MMNASGVVSICLFLRKNVFFFKMYLMILIRKCLSIHKLSVPLLFKKNGNQH